MTIGPIDIATSLPKLHDMPFWGAWSPLGTGATIRWETDPWIWPSGNRRSKPRL